ncbi:hypothetical protein ABH945_000670 [Paraburkholderia sp. GAS333]|uniref:hypothetical protein n=1 Tax=Paraburkholderia sp. GAS333 TaxID=3156279 RepID=UPI003D1D42C8
MIRTFLARGDRGGEAVITEGLDFVTCSNPPPAAYIATLGMKTYCSACKQEGYIAPRGPRWPGTGPNGKKWALSGDINICGCNPPPLFYPSRERHMTMSFTSDEAARLMGKATPVSSSAVASSVAIYDEQVRAVAARASLAGYPYLIEKADGQTVCGRIESSGRLPRIYTDTAATYTIHWGDEALALEEWQ